MTTPFYSLPVPYRGQAPTVTFPVVPSAELRSKRVWLGDPTSAYGMVELPSPSSQSLSAPRTRGRVVHGLYGGGTAVTKFANAARTWTYTWPALSERDFQLLNAFDDGATMGSPPWCLVEPEGVNRLTRAQSLCTGAGWTSSGTGTVAATTNTAPVTPGGVMQWTPNGTSVRLAGGNIVSGTTTPDTAHAMVNVPAEPMTFSFWAATTTGTGGIHARLTGMNADGSGSVGFNGSSVTVGTTGAWVSLSVTPGAFGTVPYVVPAFVADTNTTFLIANPQVSYTSMQMDWGLGGGVPRVLITSDLSRDLSLRLLTGTTLVLAEAVTGAA